MRVKPHYLLTTRIVGYMRKIIALDAECPLDRCAICQQVARVLHSGDCVRCRMAQELARSTP